MQKLKVRWKASVIRLESWCSSSWRASAIASLIDWPSVSTKFFKPRARTRAPLSDRPLVALGEKT
jgi:hypothetical protein